MAYLEDFARVYSFDINNCTYGYHTKTFTFENVIEYLIYDTYSAVSRDSNDIRSTSCRTQYLVI